MHQQKTNNENYGPDTSFLSCSVFAGTGSSLDPGTLSEQSRVPLSPEHPSCSQCPAPGSVCPLGQGGAVQGHPWPLSLGHHGSEPTCPPHQLRLAQRCLGRRWSRGTSARLLPKAAAERRPRVRFLRLPSDWKKVLSEFSFHTLDGLFCITVKCSKKHKSHHDKR